MQMNETPRILAELDPPPREIPRIMGEVKSLKRAANAVGTTLTLVQVIASVFLIALLASYMLVRFLFFQDMNTQAGISIVNNSDSMTGEIFTCLIYFSYMFIPFVLLAYIFKQNPLQIVPIHAIRKKSAVLPAVVVVLAFSFLADLVTQYIQLFLGFLNLGSSSPDFTLPQFPPALALYFFQVCILAPFCEEFLFRGVILQSLRRFGNAFAVLVSATLFSMVHGNLLQMPLAFIVGIVFGVLVIEFNSIWLTILMHFSVNFISTAVQALSIYFGNAAANISYFLLMLLCIGLSIALIVRHRHGIREKYEAYKKSVLPAQFMLKRFFLAPGMIIFTVLTVFLVVYYTKVV